MSQIYYTPFENLHKIDHLRILNLYLYLPGAIKLRMQRLLRCHPLLILLSVVALFPVTDSQLLVYRSEHDDDFHIHHQHLSERMTCHVISAWMTESGFHIQYPDYSEVSLTSDVSQGYFDVSVNGRYTHTCTFRDNVRGYAVLFTIFKKGSEIRIAPSTKSLCVPSFFNDKTFDSLIDLREQNISPIREPTSKREPFRVRFLKFRFNQYNTYSSYISVDLFTSMKVVAIQ